MGDDDVLASAGRGDTWQIAYIRSPTWVDEGGSPYRPWGALAVSADHGIIGHSDLVHPGELTIDLVLSSMDALAEAIGCRPAIVQVQDLDLAAELRDRLRDHDVAVECREDLPLIREPMEAMSRKLSEGEPFEAVLEVRGVDLDHVRRFAEGAVEFHLAKVWERLDSVDIIEVEGPLPSPDVRFGCVLGGVGQYGLGFAAHRRLLEVDAADPDHAFDTLASDRLWSVTFHEPWEVPIIEHDAWQDHDLATDDEGRIPAAILYGPKRRISRPGPAMLAFFEGMFRVLAGTTEEQLDAGRWSGEVDTACGRLRISLSLVDVLEGREPSDRAGDAPAPAPPELAAVRARELAQDAMHVRGRVGVALARRALEIDPDCAEAHLALAQRAHAPETAAERYRDAMKAAARTVGDAIFIEREGDFWEIPATRPYVLASAGLADALAADGRLEEAVTQYQKILRLNRSDHLGVRGKIVPILSMIGRDEAAAEILERFVDDPLVETLFNRALISYRRDGDTDHARSLLIAAVARNPHVADLLLGRRELITDIPPAYTTGSLEEAALYVMHAEIAWETAPGALSWLEEVMDVSR